MSLLDKASNFVQTMTGEKQRRQIVSDIKSYVSNLKSSVNNSVDEINIVISKFNELIQLLNDIRNKKVRQSINSLSIFLSHFGNIENFNEYIAEDEKNKFIISQRPFEKSDNYIKNIDWTQDEVFTNTLVLTPIGMTIKTKKQNLSMLEQLGELKIEGESILNQLKIVEYSTRQDCEIAALYIECIELISGYIEKSIIPEFEIVEAFFQASAIKNQIIVGNELNLVKFSNDINIVNNKKYIKHFNFIKNTFAFYIISCKIFNTPILTKLLSRDIQESDLVTLTDNKNLLLAQKNCVQNNMVFKRGV